MDTKPSAPSTPHTAAPSLWRNREYTRWLTGDILLDLGGGIGAFAFPLIALAATGSPALAGTVGLFQGIGTVAGIVPGGVLADRHDRRRLRLTSGALGAIAQLGLIALLISGNANVWTLSVMALADRFRGSLLGGASDAMMKHIVPASLLPKAVAVNQGRNAAINVGTGPLGGALLGLHLAAPPLAQLLGHLGSFVSTLAMRGDYDPRETDGRPTTALADLIEGATWIAHRGVILRIGVALAFLNLGMNGTVMTVTLNLANNNVNPTVTGTLMTCLAGASVIGALVAGRIVARMPSGALIISTFVICVGIALVIPFLPTVVWIGAALALAGFVSPAVNAALMGFFTLITPNAVLGRVSSMLMLMSMGLGSFAPAIAGWGLGSVGYAWTMAAFATASLVALVVVVSSSMVREIPPSPQWNAFAEGAGLMPAPCMQDPPG